MKKIIMIIASLFLFTQVSAFSVSFQDTQIFSVWEGLKEILPINITIDSDNEISKEKSFSLVLPLDSNIRFNSDFSSVRITWTWASKVLNWITIMPNLRVLKFKVAEDLKKWDNLVISWLKVVIYSKVQGDKSIWVDINGDLEADYQSINSLRVTNSNSYSDLLSPSEVFNFTWSLVGNKITLNSEMPWDVDFQWVQIDNLDKSWKVLSGFFRYDMNNFSYDLPLYIESIKIRTIDDRTNYSSWLLFSVESLKAPVITSTWTTSSTGTEFSTGHIDDIINDIEIPSIEEILKVEKVIPTFKRKSFTSFMTKLDIIINKKAYKESIMNSRNDLISLLKNYEDKKVTRASFKSKLKEKAKTLVKAFKSK